MASPRLRVKAVPGYSPCGLQTRGGSPPSSISSPRIRSPSPSLPMSSSSSSFTGSSPSIWSSDKIRAPVARILFLSSRLYGVWSLLRGRARRDEDAFPFELDAGLSPSPLLFPFFVIFCPRIARLSPTLQTVMRFLLPCKYNEIDVVPESESSIWALRCIPLLHSMCAFVHAACVCSFVRLTTFLSSPASTSSESVRALSFVFARATYFAASFGRWSRAY
mmetsp:Transcript_17097/g.23492  ORF Transcript_17097/g.23492 Transcript_17097/m.23492 type:complete len:220 (-) Transcript_17097:331-990(-)